MLPPHRGKKLSVLLFMFTALFVLCGFASAPAAENNENQKMVNMDFDQVDLKVFIKFISKLTGKNFVVDEKVQGKVTILSPSPISVPEAYKVFESVLEVNGFTTVPAGEVIKIVRTVESRQKNVQTRKKVDFPASLDERVITQIIPLDYASANQLRKILVPMVSKQGLLVGYQPTEMLILIDYETNVNRLYQIIEAVDVKPEFGIISLIVLDNASAEKIAQKMSNLLATGKQEAEGLQQGPFKIVPDERTNSLIILADKAQTDRIKQLVQELDRPTPKNLSNIQVIPLENSQAEELAKVLSSLAGYKPEEQEEAVISKNVSIVADKPSNSLVIIAQPKELETLMPIIKQLDKPRKQVFVEAAIIEVSTDTRLSLGVDWNFSEQATNDENILFGKVNSPPFGEDFNFDSQATDLISNTFTRGGSLSLGMLGLPFTATINGEERTFYGLGAFLQASQSDNNVQIISTPQLMTMENEEAQVVIAENRPFITSLQGETGTNQEFTNFEYKDVGVTLKVTPLINNQGWVKLNLFQEVSRIDPNVDFDTQTPITRKRTAETTVTVKDGQTVVIAGLMEKRTSNTKSQVPGLGDIPILGHFFKNTDNQAEKTNLMVFITPNIVQDQADAEKITYNKSRYLSKLRFEKDGRIKPIPDEFIVFSALK
ncbi:MAG: type II secretion system secretin GspD [Desulfohalobiaceae bacterium]|nr:type II secretion system secretin GspD [Desulfohalobiaceae bacterium]